mgnify:CR=1 FL=1
MSKKNDIQNQLDNIDYSASDILNMLKGLPDACCIFKVLTDPFGTVTDMQFLFANEKYASLVGKSTAELIGATYYTTVSNRDEDWIRLSYQAAFMRQSVINRTFNTQFDKWFEFWAVPVYKKGFCAFVIHDVTALKRREDDRKTIANSRNIILECAKVLSKKDFKAGIKSALKILGTELKADRVYVIASDHGDQGDIFEWSDNKSGNGLPSKNDLAQFDLFTMWTKQLRGEDVIIVDDTSHINKVNSAVYDEVLSGKITRYILAAIRDKSDVIGYLIADNFDTETDINIKEVFETVSIFISEELRNYTLAKEMIYLSNHDVLTDLGNRHSFNNTLSMLKDMDVTVGVCFVDINGLKKVNDTKGHEAGDILIKDVANAISTVFKKKYCYRIGGDEFVAIIPQIDEERFGEEVEKLRKKSKKVPMAIGAIWRDNPGNTEELVNIADSLMYEDKAQFYSAENDRRR